MTRRWWAGVGGAAILTVALAGFLNSRGTVQASASCYIAGSGVVDVTFNNPTANAIQPDWVTVVTFGADGGEDWSDIDWSPSGMLGGFVVAAGQQVTYIGNDNAYPPAGAATCQVASWRND